MTKRFFYTDPLAAAWMAKHFGMKFISARDIFTDTFIVNILIDDACYEAISYIHPDSLRLLVPKQGDLLTGRNRRVFMFHDGNMRPTENARIMERNGIAFMNPEIEGA